MISTRDSSVSYSFVGGRVIPGKFTVTPVILSKIDHDVASQGLSVGCAAFECAVLEQDGDTSSMSTPVEVLDAEFFDEELLVLVYRGTYSLHEIHITTTINDDSRYRADQDWNAAVFRRRVRPMERSPRHPGRPCRRRDAESFERPCTSMMPSYRIPPTTELCIPRFPRTPYRYTNSVPSQGAAKVL